MILKVLGTIPNLLRVVSCFCLFFLRSAFFERQNKRDTMRERKIDESIFHPLVRSLDGHNRKGWAMLMLGASGFIWSLLHGWQGLDSLCHLLPYWETGSEAKQLGLEPLQAMALLSADLTPPRSFEILEYCKCVLENSEGAHCLECEAVERSHS